MLFCLVACKTCWLGADKGFKDLRLGVGSLCVQVVRREACVVTFVWQQ